jgi:signal transduction histidine kinase
MGRAAKAYRWWTRSLHSAQSGLSICTHVIALILAVVMPLLGFCALLVLCIATHDAPAFASVGRSNSIIILILAGGLALALAVMLAMVIGRRIGRAITKLVDFSEVVGGDGDIALPATGIRETDAVARSLYLFRKRQRQNDHERSILGGRAIAAQEAERKRIARELHDSLGQNLAALGLGLGAIEPHCASNQTAHQRLAELKALASALSCELHGMASGLWPMALDDLGLKAAVTQYVEEWAERSRLKIDLEISLNGRRLSKAAETAVFRTLQDTISNVVEHSGADRVGVILETGDCDVRLIVEDNGRGVGAEWREQGGRHARFLGIHERLSLVGGSLEVESSEEGGTTVFANIPL